MEKRIKNVGSYIKSGRCFINIDKKNAILDSISKYEFNIFQYENHLSLRNIEFNKFFIDKDIRNFENKKVSNESFNHSIKAYDYFKNLYFSSLNLAIPSTFSNLTYVKNQNININELEKYPKFLEVKQNKKIENINNSIFGKKYFNDTNIENLYKIEKLFTNQNSNFKKSYSNSNSYYKYIQVENKNISRQENLINSKEEFSSLELSQKNEKYFEINIVPTGEAKDHDLILQFSNPVMEESLDDENEYTTFSSAQIHSGVLSKKRSTGNINDRRFYKFNTPFSIYNFSKKAWEYRGLIYPVYHMATEYIESYLGSIYPSIDQQTINGKNIVKIKILEKDNNLSKKINDTPNGFLDFFKKYFCYYCPLTNTPSIIIKRKTNNQVYDMLLDFPFLSVPTEQFGFPNHFKFHCFEDNLIEMKNFIEKPFVLNRTSFSTNVEIICEVNDEEGYFEEPVNACLNYFIIKQTSMFENQNVNTDWSPVSLNKEAYQVFISGSSNSFKEDLKIEKDTNVTDNTQKVVRLLNNQNIIFNYNTSSYDNKLEPGSLYDYNFYFGSNTLNGDLDISNNQKHIREIVNFGNAVFLTPPKSLVEDYYPALGEPYGYTSILNNKFLNYLNQNNFDFMKVVDYPNHQKILDDLNLTAILDFSGEISINSPCRANTLIKNTVNSHLINFDFELSAGNNFEKLNLQRSLNNINSGKHIVQSTDFENKIFSSNITDNFGEVYIPSGSDARIYKNKYYAQGAQDLNSKSLSPYVLYPHDKIALCVSISPIIHPKPIKQIIAIKDGKCKFSLFGHFLQDEKKITDENDVLKNYHTNNFPNVIIGDILNTNEYSDFTNLDYLTYPDRLYTKNNKFISGNRELDDPSSIISSGKTYIPYNRIGNDYNLNTNEKFIYDDAFLQYTQEYKVTGNSNLVPTYYKNNIFNDLLVYKKYDYELNNENFNESFKNLNLKTFNCYFSKSRYGHLRDMFEQRSYTALYNIANNIKENIIEKQFINSVNGQTITDLTEVPNINKSLTYELVNSGLNPVEIQDVLVEDIGRLPYPFYDNVMRWNKWTWTLNEISKSKHVAFMENVSA